MKLKIKAKNNRIIGILLGIVLLGITISLSYGLISGTSTSLFWDSFFTLISGGGGIYFLFKARKKFEEYEVECESYDVIKSNKYEEVLKMEEEKKEEEKTEEKTEETKEESPEEKTE